MAIAKSAEKPKKTGVYFVEMGDEWDVVVVEEVGASGELFCPVNGVRDDWPTGIYYGPVDIDYIKRVGHWD